MANYVIRWKDGKAGRWEKDFSLLLFYSCALAFSVGIFVCLILAAGAFAEERETRRSRENRTSRNVATTIDESLQDALRRIPWDALSSAAKTKIKPVIATHSIFRRLPLQAVYTDAEMYQFLVEHPDIVVGFWEKLGVTQISLRELSEDRFLMKETGGTTAVAEVLYRTRDICIVYAKGQYRGTLLAKPIDGEAVLILRSRFLRDEDNEPYTICQLDSFVRLDNVGVDLVAKLFSSVLGKIADGNFEQTVGFVGNVSEAATTNTERVKDLSLQMKGVRKEVRDDFSDVADRVAARGAKRGTLEFPEYVELPIPAEPATEPAPFTAYGIPMPIIARQTQPFPTERNVTETSNDMEVSAIHDDAASVPIGFSMLGDGLIEPTKGRVIFRKPNVPAAN